MRYVLASVLVLLLTWLPASAAPVIQPDPPDPARPGLVEALSVLRAWDERRERAWATADEQALQAIYAPGSSAGRADVAMLRDYRARGLVVRRMHTQLLALEVLVRTPDRLRLRVLDRVAGGAVQRGGEVLPLEPTRPSAHTIELRRYAGRWRVDEVSATVSEKGRAPRAAPQPRQGR